MYIASMDDRATDLIRLANLKKLAGKEKNPTQFASKIERDPSYVIRLLKGKKIGEDVARHIEQALSLPEGWMDKSHEVEDTVMDYISEAVREYYKEAGLKQDYMLMRKTENLLYKLVAEHGVGIDVGQKIVGLLKEAQNNKA